MATTATNKYVYSFGGGKADGKAEMKALLGGKGANLAEMSVIGIPVPPGFTITTEVCAAYYENGQKLPEEVKPQVEAALKEMEGKFGAKFGDPARSPLLVSVRSGAAMSMPGMMNTILNLGLTDVSVEGVAKKTGNPRFAYDGYRRLIDMFGSTAMGVEHELFEHELHTLKQEKGVKLDTELSADDLKELVKRYKAVYKHHVGKDFPQDPKEQLWAAIMAVFNSWEGKKAVEYRRIERITGLKGTAVNVQAMVFGNMGDNSGTGVAFTRDPNTGEDVFYGDYLINAQGEDVVAGIRTPEPISQLKDEMPKVYEQLMGIRQKLESHYKEMQDIEFTVQDGKLYMLQTRTGKRTGTAAVRIAVEMVKEGLIDKETAIKRVSPDSLNHLLLPQLDPKAKLDVVAQGIAASPGAAAGKIVLSAEAAVEHAQEHPGDPILLVRKETSPEDVAGMNLARGILTATGGKASHAAVVARGWGKPCIVGCAALQIDEKEGTDQHRRPGRQGGRLPHDQRHDRRRHDRQGRHHHARDQRRLRHPDGVGRRGPHPQGPHQRRHPPGRRQGPLLRRRGDRPLPDRAHVLRGPADRRHAQDDPGRRRGRPQGRAGRARALPARGLRRHLRGDGRPPRDHPPARPAAARVPPPRRGRPGRGRPPARHPGREGQAPGRAAARVQPDARPPRLPPADQATPRSATCRSAPSSRRPSRSRSGARRSCPRS